MASSSSSGMGLGTQLLSQFTCGLCKNMLKKPRALPCLHSFCEECLKGITGDEMFVSKVVCPTCKQRVGVPGGNVANFPMDFLADRFLSVVMEMDPEAGQNSADESSANEKNKNYEQCYGHNKIKDMYCHSCAQVYCQDCSEDHVDHAAGTVQDAAMSAVQNVSSLANAARDRLPPLQESIEEIRQAIEDVEIQHKLAEDSLLQSFEDIKIALHERKGHLLEELNDIRYDRVSILKMKRNEFCATIKRSLELSQRVTECLEGDTDTELLYKEPEISDKLYELINKTMTITNKVDDVEIEFEFKPKKLTESLDLMGRVGEIEFRIGADDGEESSEYEETPRDIVSLGPQNGTEDTTSDPQEPKTSPVQDDGYISRSEEVPKTDSSKDGQESAEISESSQKQMEMEEHSEEQLTVTEPKSDGVKVESPPVVTSAPSREKSHVPAGVSREKSHVPAGVSREKSRVPAGTAREMSGVQRTSEYSTSAHSTATDKEESKDVFVLSESLDSSARTTATSRMRTARRQILSSKDSNPCFEVVFKPPDTDTISRYRDISSTPVIEMGGKGHETGKLYYPYGVAITQQDHLLVSDQGNSRVQVLDRWTGQCVLSFGGEGSVPGMFNGPSGVTCYNDMFFISDTGNDIVQIFDNNGAFIRCFGGGKLHSPRGISVSNNHVYIANSGMGNISVFDLETGKLLGLLHNMSPHNCDLQLPTGVTHDEEGDIYFTDANNFFCNHFIQVITKEHTYKQSVGVVGNAAGEFLGPSDITVDELGNVIIADTRNHRIQIVDKNNSLVSCFGGFGRKRGLLHFPYGVCQKEGVIYVSDTNNHRIQVFNATSG